MGCFHVSVRWPQVHENKSRTSKSLQVIGLDLRLLTFGFGDITEVFTACRCTLMQVPGMMGLARSNQPQLLSRVAHHGRALPPQRAQPLQRTLFRRSVTGVVINSYCDRLNSGRTYRKYPRAEQPRNSHPELSHCRVAHGLVAVNKFSAGKPHRLQVCEFE